MDEILREIHEAILRCETALAPFDKKSLRDFRSRLEKEIANFGNAWSGSWLGYQSTVYIADFAAKSPGEAFSVEYGIEGTQFNVTTVGPWVEYPPLYVRQILMTRARVDEDDWDEAKNAASAARKAFKEVQSNMVPTLAALFPDGDPHLSGRLIAIESLKAYHSKHSFIGSWRPQNKILTSDLRATSGGRPCPPHLELHAELLEAFSTETVLRGMAEHLHFVLKYLEVRHKSKMSTPTPKKEPSMGPKTKTACILFMDVSGWSKLNARNIFEYVTKAMPELEKQISGHDFINTWGDAIVATFGSAKEAAESALRIKDFFVRGYPHDGVAEGLTCRISLHTGEIILCENPLRSGSEDIFGDAVHLAARLEPATAPGHVFCTSAFAALLKGVDGLAPRAWPLPNKLRLPKGYGEVEASVVTWRNEQDPRPGLAAFPDSTAAPSTSTASPDAQTAPSDDAARVRLRGWVGTLPVKRSSEAISLAEIDRACTLAPGTAHRLLPEVVKKTGWVLTEMSETDVILTRPIGIAVV